MTMATVRRACWMLMLVALAAWSDRTAGACSCIKRDHACAVVFATDAIFRGRVLSIESALRPPLPGMRGTYTMRRVTFAVAERFRGDVAAAHIDVFTGMNDGDCGYDFKADVEYLVYAHAAGAAGESRTLETGICSWTKPTSEAGADLAFLQALKTKPESLTSRIFGTVRLDSPNFDELIPGSQASPPQAGIPITLTRGGVAHRTETDGTGAFEFLGLSAGAYELNAQLAEGYAGWGLPRQVELPAPQACADASVSIRYDGRVSGRIVNSAGIAMAGVTLELGSAKRVDDPQNFRRMTAQSRADGSYELAQVPPGRYVLGINTQYDWRARNLPYPRLLFPGTRDAALARVVEVAPGERVRIPDFTLPADFEMVAITGVVTMADGTPVAGANVILASADRNDHRPAAGPAATDDAGRFTLAGLSGVQYRLIAHKRTNAGKHWTSFASDDAPAFTAAAGLPSVRLIVKDRTKPQ